MMRFGEGDVFGEVTPANNNILSNCLNSLEQQINGGNPNLLTLVPKLLQNVNAFLTCLTTSCTPVGINNSTGEIPNGINFNGSFSSANITYANNNQGYETAEITCAGYPGYFACIDYYLNGTQVGQNCNNITLGQSISINETCNQNRTWGPVSLDAVSCNYLLPPCAKCQLIGTNQDTEAPDSSSYQIDNQWCLAAEIVCAGNASSFACMDYNLNGAQISQTCTGVLGGPITLDETCTNVTQWGPVHLDSVGCLYVPEIGILPSYPNTTNQTLPSANVTYQNFAQGYPEAIITCPAQQGYYACVDFYLNGTKVGQNCANAVTETWNSQRQWGPVQLDSVGCTYYLS
uniref:Uncharacterized protein n=1 Tax=Acrobeloides nanus TaxID=290746 RepID=A0A914EBB2_9BILA